MDLTGPYSLPYTHTISVLHWQVEKHGTKFTSQHSHCEIFHSQIPAMRLVTTGSLQFVQFMNRNIKIKGEDKECSQAGCCGLISATSFIWVIWVIS